MKLAVIILLFALLIASQINTIVSVDLWWSLKTGEYIVKNLKIPHSDIFSYTLAGREWIDHEWLSQVIFYSIFSKFGWLGMSILKALIIALCFIFPLGLAYTRYRNIIFSIFIMLGAIFAFGYRSFVRPEIFSYLFLSVYLYILEKRKSISVLPFLQVIWVNLHGYFIMGPLLILLYCTGDFFSKDRFEARRLCAVFFWAIAACFINPYFYKGAFYPIGIFRDVFTEQRLFMQNVHELMMPIRAGFSKFFFFWIFSIIASLTFLINLKGIRIRHIMVFALSFLASYMAVRNMPIFIFLAMPLAIVNLNESDLTKNMAEKKYYILCGLALCGAIYIFLSGRYYDLVNQSALRKPGSGFSELLMPKGACDFLEENNINGRLFNTLDFGPYIGYRFFPERRIFIDTRTELYKDDFYMLYRRAQNYPDEWRRLHKEYGFEIAVIRHLFSGTEKLLRYLYKAEDWVLVYYDRNSCVFLSNVPENEKFITMFGIDFSKKSLTLSDIDINIARFFDKIGENSFAEDAYTELLKKDPKYLEAANNLAAIYIDTARYDKALDMIRRFLGYYPRSAELHANMGTAYLRSGKRKEGLFMLEKAAMLNPYLRQASYMLGTVYLEEGDIDRAMRQFIKYSRLDPYNIEAHRILGDIYAQKGFLKKAMDEYTEAKKLGGE